MTTNHSIPKSSLPKTNAVKCSPLWLLLLLLLTLPATLQAQFNYTTNNGTVTIWGYTGPGGDVTIPATLDGLPVTAIEYRAFAYNPSLTNVTLPNSLAFIGTDAFYECTNLATVTIPNGVITIGRSAFLHCASLRSLTIPNTVTTIDFSAFHSCVSLTNVFLGAGVTNIGLGGAAGSSAFAWCTNLATITVDAGNSAYRSLDGVLFNKDQTSLVLEPAGKRGSYSLPAGVTRIGAEAFYSCTALTNVSIPNGVTNIGLMAFMYSGLRSVTMPDTLTTISQKAFYRCSNLVEVLIPDSVTSMEFRAFAWCTTLSTVSIPDSVTNIGAQPFIGCSNLTAITVAAVNPAYSSFDGLLFNKDQTTLLQFPGGKASSYVIPSGVTAIGSGAFAACSALTSVTIPSSLTNLASGIFDSCSNLTGIYFQGNAPGIKPGSLLGPAPLATVFYVPGTTGWGSTFGGLPAVLWNAVMQTSSPSFGVGPNGFGFTIQGSANLPVVIEASTNLASGWFPLQSLTLPNGQYSFSDPDSANHPTRFYRLRWP